MVVRIHKVDRVIELKVKVFDVMRRLEVIQSAMNEAVQIKNKHLKELQDLENKLVNKYIRAKALV